MTSQEEIKLLKQNLQECLDLLRVCEKQVGTVLGEQIAEITSRLEGKKFNPKDWDLKDRNGEQ